MPLAAIRYDGEGGLEGSWFFTTEADSIIKAANPLFGDSEEEILEEAQSMKPAPEGLSFVLPGRSGAFTILDKPLVKNGDSANIDRAIQEFGEVCAPNRMFLDPPYRSDVPRVVLVDDDLLFYPNRMAPGFGDLVKDAKKVKRVLAARRAAATRTTRNGQPPFSLLKQLIEGVVFALRKNSLCSRLSFGSPYQAAEAIGLLLNYIELEERVNKRKREYRGIHFDPLILQANKFTRGLLARKEEERRELGRWIRREYRALKKRQRRTRRASQDTA